MNNPRVFPKCLLPQDEHSRLSRKNRRKGKSEGDFNMLWNNKVVHPDLATNEDWGKSPAEPSLPILDLDKDLPYFPQKTPIKTVRKVELQLEYN